MTVFTSSNLQILKSCSEKDCSLNWDIIAEDNKSPECYLLGTAYFIRLYKIPTDLDVTVFSTNGSVILDSSVDESIIDEYVIFTGEQIGNLSKPYYSSFSYTLIGNAYKSDGTVISNITFTITPGTKEIKASTPCYAVILVNYISTYKKYRFSGSSLGNLLIVATATCENENQVSSTETVLIKSGCAGECLSVLIDIDTSSDTGAAYDAQGSKLFLVYGVGKEDICVAATRGSVSFLDSYEEQIEEEITGTKSSFSATKYVYSIIEQIPIGKSNVSSLYIENGNLKMSTNPGDLEIECIPPGCGSIKIKYLTKCLRYLVTSSEPGNGIFVVKDLNYDETSDCDQYFFSTYSIGTEAGIQIYDITLIYKDFVTGETLSDAQVWVDNVYRGTTDINGEILVKGLSADIQHSAKASKIGYLTTDSDSLANDNFIIRSK